MSQEEPLEELKGIEAALASLVPRRDLLDRDRLMYLAGRASVLAERRSRRAAWAWPAAFSGMTAVAVTLLVVLVTRPGVQVATSAAPPPLPAAADPKAPSARPNLLPRDAPRPADSVIAVTQAEYPGYTGLGSRELGPTAHYPLLLARVLQSGLDAWPPEVSASAPTREGPAPPSSYRELREEMLDGRPASPARLRVLPELLLPGAKS